MACCCELQNTLDVEVTQESLLDVEIGGSAGVLLQAKSVEVTENGTSVVAPDDGFDGLKSVEINTNVPKRFECGDALFNINGYNGNNIYYKITKVNVSCLVTSKTTSLNSTFKGLSSCVEIIGVENWDTSNVTNMYEVFYECFSLKSIDISGFNTSNVTNICAILYRCKALSSKLDLSSWDVSRVTNMDLMFGFCESLIWLDISSWDASSVTRISQPFDGCKLLKTIIGYKTLQDVENGLKTMIGLKVGTTLAEAHALNFSSILSFVNGIADLTGQKEQTLTISKKSYNNMYNDDGTLPTKDVIAERQARIAAICASKNWNFAH